MLSVLVAAQNLYITRDNVLSPGWLLISDGVVLKFGAGEAPSELYTPETRKEQWYGTFSVLTWLKHNPTNL